MQRWLRPPRRLSPTRAGWCFFALTFGVGFAALNTGNNLLYLVLSLMLAFLVLSGVLSESALRGVAVRRRLPRELYAERDAWIGIEIANRQRRVVAYALVVEDRWIDDHRRERSAGRCFALRIAPGASEQRSYRLRPERRGELAFAGFVVSTRFPFGLFSKSRAPPKSRGIGTESTAGYTSARSGASNARDLEKRPNGKRVDTTKPANASSPRRSGRSR